MGQVKEIRSGNMSLDEAMAVVQAEGYTLDKDNPELAEDFGHIDIFESQKITATQTANGRWYHLEGDENRDNWRPSMTTCLKSLSLGPGYDDWLLTQHDYKKRDAKGIKGTHAHHWDEQLVYGNVVTIDDIYNKVINEKNHAWRELYSRPEHLVEDIAKHMESFMAFWKDKNPKPLACEYAVYDKDLPFAGRLDLIVRMKKTKASKKESIVMIDIKTGLKYPSHALQNTGYKMAWDKEHPEHIIDEIACLYTKDSYRKEPTYNLSYSKYSPEAMLRAVGCWYDQNLNKDGKVIPAVKKHPRRVFNLYNQKEGA